MVYPHSPTRERNSQEIFCRDFQTLRKYWTPNASRFGLLRYCVPRHRAAWPYVMQSTHQKVATRYYEISEVVNTQIKPAKLNDDHKQNMVSALTS
jgi:hypothetical protein